MKRTDVEDLLKGKGNYVDDVKFSGYHAVFVRSSYPHAKIKVDAQDAKNKGALVLTGEDLQFSLKSEITENEGSANLLPLAYNKVRYVGEPIAVVIAKDVYTAMDLAETVNVDYQPLEPVGSIEEALENRSLVFEEVGSNVVYNKVYEYGSMPNDREIELNLYWSRSSGNPIETFGVITYPEGDSLTIISNMQASYMQAQDLSKYLGKIRVIPARQGGSFGSKFSLKNYVLAIALASKKFNIPIKWIETRTEHLEASNSSGPERKFKIKAYFKNDGTITGLDFKVWEDVGASLFNGQAFKPLGILAGPYKVRNIRYDASLVATNKNPPGAFRGAGTPPHTWALERVVDSIADELKMDRAEIRMKNFIDEFPYESPYAFYDSGNPKKLMEIALSRKEIFNLRNQGYGVGIASSTDPSTPSGQEGVKIEVKGGKITLGIGYGPEGQGNEHTGKILLSQMLGVPLDKIEVKVLDNNESPYSFGPGGSRMSVFLSGAIKGAVEELIRNLRSQVGEAKFENGYFIKGDQKVSILELEGSASYVYSLQGKTRFNAYPFAVDIAVVKVDESGIIRPVKLIVYIDPGTPLDEDLVKEQIIGGSFIGVSVALYERYVYSNGQLLTSNLSDYNFPTALEMPEFEVNIVPTPSPYTPMGSKGIGEIPVGIAAAAMTSAVEDALKRKINSVPITPDNNLQ
ncbi:xanthine dehydrogenase family protein molybdopterin-binding subunit [Acidianus brierleyi]|uniref:Xanthine dehydrogenase family protein molybdopterin-binding subunit n=1 Tax=Acidianus brierleyi TaxID=41673 RepID=A0A2U9IHG5_9CREN|nr:xanthine dehydrogenase family protein molybdopterin-binding subunit [Acidianus brierleyi]AWR95469.1 molybdopterin-dependent oxidoreductase [Acidianus brierleyi]